MNNNEQNQAKSNINWYPGHMLKAINEIKKDLKYIDIVIEVVDARIPKASRNPIIEEISKDKQRIIVFNKYDLADKEELKRYTDTLKDVNLTFTNANLGENIQGLIKQIKEIGRSVYEEKDKLKGVERKRIYRILIVGIPNVGKSTLINKLSKKTSALVGNKPGVTKQKQWIRVDDNIELLDTPGILWPKLSSNNGILLGITGNIKQEILDSVTLAIETIKLLLNNTKYVNLLKNRYNLSDEDIQNDEYELLGIIGKKRGCIKSGNNIDYDKVSNIILDDMKNGKIGNITFI